MMSSNGTRFAGACVVLAHVVGMPRARPIVLQPGPEGKDAQLGGYYPQQNWGADELVNFGSYLGVHNARPVFEFDLSAAPPQFPLTQAILTLTQRITFGVHHRYRAHVKRLTEPWHEMEVTWLNRTATEPWSIPGGVFVDTGASTVFTTQQVYAPVDIDVTALVGGWLDHTYPNFGLLLMPDTLYVDPPGTPTNNYAAFVTSDHTLSAYHPKLTLVPEPAAAVTIVLGTVMTCGRRSRQT